MNVYDFDKTIYEGDSTRHFYFYCLKKYPLTFLGVPSLIFGYFLYFFKLIDKTRFKEYFYVFLSFIREPEKAVNDFWRMHEKNIKKWYLAQKKDDDVIISASPVFLLKSISSKLNVRLIASEVNINTGKTAGKNCFGDEKVRRFYEEFPEGVIDSFYSDSIVDTPLARISKESFTVTGEKIEKWKWRLN